MRTSGSSLVGVGIALALVGVGPAAAAPAWKKHTINDRSPFEAAGVWDVDGVAWRLRERPAHIRIPAPRFAEHNDYVYRHLIGLSDADVASLTQAGVIGDQPDTSIHQ